MESWNLHYRSSSETGLPVKHLLQAAITCAWSKWSEDLLHEVVQSLHKMIDIEVFVTGTIHPSNR